MDDKRIWKDEYEIKSYHVDLNKKLRLSTLFTFFQESAFRHAEFHQAGYSSLMQENTIWLLSKLFIKFDRLPGWGEKIILKTWPKKPKRLYALRDFQIIDQDSNIICSGGSAWVLFDFHKRRPRKPDEVIARFPGLTGRDALEYNLSKIPDLTEYTESYSHKAAYSDIDLYRHVNNSRYVEWIMNSFPGDFFETGKIKQIRIDFMNEALFGDEVVINKQTGDGQLFFNCIRKNDNKEIIRSVITTDF